MPEEGDKVAENLPKAKQEIGPGLIAENAKQRYPTSPSIVTEAKAEVPRETGRGVLGLAGRTEARPLWQSRH